MKHSEIEYMNACMERSKQRMFVRKLETASTLLAAWAQDRFNDGFSIEDVKFAICTTAKLIEKDDKMQIGGKTKTLKPTQPQYVVQLGEGYNEFLKLGEEVTWVGDPNAATKFDSKYAAKSRVKDLADVPNTRCFRELV